MSRLATKSRGGVVHCPGDGTGIGTPSAERLRIVVARWAAGEATDHQLETAAHRFGKAVVGERGRMLAAFGALDDAIEGA